LAPDAKKVIIANNETLYGHWKKSVNCRFSFYPAIQFASSGSYTHRGYLGWLIDFSRTGTKPRKLYFATTVHHTCQKLKELFEDGGRACEVYYLKTIIRDNFAL
jgi:hypothetical protein